MNLLSSIKRRCLVEEQKKFDKEEMKDIFFTKGPREPKKNAKNYWALPLHILLSLNTHLRWFFPLFRTNKCNFFRLWKLKWRWWFWWGSTITYSIWDCEHCNVHKRFVFCKSRRAISCSLQIKMCNYCKVQVDHWHCCPEGWCLAENPPCSLIIYSGYPLRSLIIYSGYP